MMTMKIMLMLLLLMMMMHACVCQVYFYYYHVSNLLVTTNSSVNFVVYCVFRRQFRRRLYACCCPSQHAKRHSSTNTELHPLHSSIASANARQLPVVPIKAPWLEMDRCQLLQIDTTLTSYIMVVDTQWHGCKNVQKIAIVKIVKNNKLLFQFGPHNQTCVNVE